MEIVREFYCAMIPEAFSAYHKVIVRGCHVKISQDTINNYLGIKGNFKNYTNGLPRHEYFKEEMDPRLASALRMDGNPHWDNGVNDIKLKEVDVDSNFWMVFVKHNILPASHRNEVTAEVAKVLFCIKNKMPIDIGTLAKAAMVDAGFRKNAVFPFPCLVTRMCQEAGVQLEGAPHEMGQCREPLGKKFYNIILSQRDLPLLSGLRSKRKTARRRGLPPFQGVDQEEEEDDQQARQDAGGDADVHMQDAGTAGASGSGSGSQPHIPHQVPLQQPDWFMAYEQQQATAQAQHQAYWQEQALAQQQQYQQLIQSQQSQNQEIHGLREYVQTRFDQSDLHYQHLSDQMRDMRQGIDAFFSQNPYNPPPPHGSSPPEDNQ